ncbi:MAG TPA: CheR family methyltransferase, partial [Thermomicrobiales bacterium]|nr:CheR family methyltransferase [Thermomicrobiales bacterium]
MIVQSPETAAFPGMPLAVPPSAIDIVADLEAIGPLLVDLARGAYVVPATDDDGELRAFLERIRERSGLDFNAYKRPTIVRRLQRRMAAVGAATLADYRRYVERHPDEMQRLVAGFLIKVTEFFRDPDFFLYLRDSVLPTLIAEAKERGELRLWSAGCATGEEAYTLAMLVSDLLSDDLGNLHVRIFATDIAAEAVDFARRGVYPAAALENLPPDLVDRHFIQLDGAYEVRKPVRALVIFGEHDLGYRAPFPRIDLVVCRNVLIYFTPELQRRALQLFAFSLRQGGYLALGKAETVSPLPEFFALEQPRLKVFRRIGEPAPIPATSLLDISPYAGAATRASRRLRPSRGLDLAPAPARPRDPGGGPLTPRMFELLPTGLVVVERNYHSRSINVTA